MDSAAESVAVSLGYGDHAEIAALLMQLNLRAPVREFEASKLTGHVDLGVGYLRGHAGWTDNNEIVAAGVTPLLRLQFPNDRTTGFFEGGVGFRFLSATSIYDTRRFSTAFQFGEILGIGMRFGAAQAFEVGVRVEHISNGGIKRPNDGLTFAVIRFGYHYD